MSGSADRSHFDIDSMKHDALERALRMRASVAEDLRTHDRWLIDARDGELKSGAEAGSPLLMSVRSRIDAVLNLLQSPPMADCLDQFSQQGEES